MGLTLVMVTICGAMVGCVSAGQTVALKSGGWTVKFEVPPGTKIKKSADWAMNSKSNSGDVEWVINVFDSEKKLSHADAEEMHAKNERENANITVGPLTTDGNWWWWRSTSRTKEWVNYVLVNRKGECRFSGADESDMERLRDSIINMN